MRKNSTHACVTKQKLKILLATGIYPPDIGGPATYVKVLEEELPKFGFEVKVATYGEGEGMNYISRSQNLLIRYMKYFLAVWKMRNWANLVYIQGPVSEGLPTALVCKLSGKKYLMKIVGDYAWEQGRQRFGVKDLLDDFQDKKYNIKVELLRRIQRWTASGAELVITPSEYLKTIVCKWGIQKDKIKVIYNSVKDVKLNISKERAKEELRINGDIVLSSGRLVPWKGFDLLIELMPELLKIKPNLKLCIIGEGPDKDKLYKKIKENKLEESVILAGGVKQDILWKYMRAADVFVLNTGYEGLSHVLVEAMQFNLPIATSNIGGNPEVVNNNVTGILFEYNKKDEIKEVILNLLKDDKKRNELAERAKTSSSKFSKQKMINSVVCLLEEHCYEDIK